MRITFLLIVASLFLFSQSLSAQSSSNTTILEIEGVKYYSHKTLIGETISSICRDYNIDQKKLIECNPSLSDGLKAGEQIKIPIIKGSGIGSQKVLKSEIDQNDGFIYHVVQKKETAYSIAKKYNVSLSSLFQYNVEVQRGVREHDVVRVPKTEVMSNENGLINEDSKYYYHKVRQGEGAISVAKHYGSSLSDLYALNPEAEKNFLVGMELKISKIPLEQPSKVEVVSPMNFTMYKVEPKDNFTSLNRKFGVTQDELVSLNPELAKGVQIGMEIKIPVKSVQSTTEPTSVSNSKVVQHKVLPGETLYGLLKKYGITDEQLVVLNPQLKDRGVNADEVILIPDNGLNVSESSVQPSIIPIQNIIPSQTITSEETIYTPIFKRNAHPYNVMLFMPFNIEKNGFADNETASDESLSSDSVLTVETDSSKIQATSTSELDTMIVEPQRSLNRNTRDYICFYEGVLLALDSLQKAGVNIRLYVYDYKDSKAIVDSIIRRPEMLSANLIIGPVDVKHQESLSNFSFKNHIPMVSPLMASDKLTTKNPYYLQINPNNSLLIRKTVNLVGKESSKNFVLVKMGAARGADLIALEGQIRDKVRSKPGTRFNEVDFYEFRTSEIIPYLKADEPNTIFVSAADEPKLSSAINGLYTLSNRYDLNLIGLNSYKYFRSIMVDSYHILNLKYVGSNYIDYKSEKVKQFVRRYREYYYAEPDQFSFRGYDLMYYFGSAMGEFGKNYFDNIPKYKKSMLQVDFNFSKVNDMGGLMNNSTFIINENRDYDITKLGKL